jgi:endonuclease III related protein
MDKKGLSNWIAPFYCSTIERKETMNAFQAVYTNLFAEYGPQGWWPLLSRESAKDALPGGYVALDYDSPKNKNDIVEISTGAILTQNTNWVNVTIALRKLKSSTNFEIEKLLSLDSEELKLSIKSSGYYNVKAKKLYILWLFLQKLFAEKRKPSREELLSLWGIGPETADSILLYAFHELRFVIDAYSRRIGSRLGILDSNSDYQSLQNLFQENLSANISVYMECHALLVRHAKEHCSISPLCESCPLASICKYRI